ncbi:MAG: hypothetical protein AABY04_00105 [Candidatus Micrarchaeota archaeon]
MADIIEGRKNVYTAQNPLKKWAKAGIIGAGVAYAAFVGFGNEGYYKMENRRLYEGYSPRQIQIADSLGTLSSEKLGANRAFDTYKNKISAPFFNDGNFNMGKNSREKWEGVQKNRKDSSSSNRAGRVLELFARTENYFENPSVSVGDKAEFRAALLKNEQKLGFGSIIAGAYRNPAIYFKTVLGLMKTNGLGIKGKIALVIQGKRKSELVSKAVTESNLGRMQFRQAMAKRDNLNRTLIGAFAKSQFRLGKARR